MQAHLRDNTLHQLLAAYSAPAVAPAGISGAALGAAIGAALIVKVALITERKMPQGAERDKVLVIADKVQRHCALFEGVVDEDAKAYAALVRVKSAHAKGLENDETLDRAMKKATIIPGTMGRAAMLCINLSADLVNVAYPPALWDLAMGAWLCHAAVEASLMAVRHNVTEISDTAFCEKILSKLDFFDHRAAAMERIMAVATERKRQAS